MDNQGNILKLSFLMSYLALLICVVIGIPFMTCVFRAIVLMCIFSIMGYALRWFLYHVVSSVEPEKPEKLIVDSDEDMGEFDMSAGEGVAESEDYYQTAMEPVDQDGEQE